ncbi:MAG: AAA family ATPase, partial [Candidatus Acidiferrales bacterium]
MSTPFRDVQEYARALEMEPSLLRDAETSPSGNEATRRIIRVWDEIPDVMTMAVAKTEWIVGGILPRGSVTLIAGEPGSYKSWLALSLLRGVAGGGKFLERE